MSEEEVPIPAEKPAEKKDNTFIQPSENQPFSDQFTDSIPPLEKLDPLFQTMADHAELVHDSSKFLDLLIDQTIKVTGADILLLFHYEGEEKEWTLLSFRGMPKEFAKNGIIPRAWQSLPTIVLRQGSALFSDEISKDPVFIGQMIRGLNLQTFAGTTLRSKGGVVGSLSIGFAKPSAMTQKDREDFLRIGKLLSPFAIPYLKEGKSASVDLTVQDMAERAVLEKELSEKRIALDLLESLFSSLSRSFQEKTVFQAALEKIIPLMNVDGGYLLQYDEIKQRFFPVAQKGLSLEKAQRLEKQGVKVGENVIGKVFEKKVPIFAVSEDQKTVLKKRFVGEEGLLSYMVVPILASDRMWGTLSLFSRNRVFMENELKILAATGREIGFAVDNMKLFDRAKRRVEDLTIINEVSQSVTRSLHLDQLLSSVANSFTKMIGASNCYLFSVDDKRNVLYGVAASDQRGEAVRKIEVKVNENTILPLTAREQHPFVIENALQDPKVGKRWIDLFKSRSILSVPLIIKERVIGVVLLDETRYFRQFTQEEIQKAVTLANQVAVAIENATLYQAVTKHRERLQTLSSAIVNIQEEERRRIARELHDEAGQALTAIKMNLDWVEKELSGSEQAIRERINEIKDQVVKILEELRRLSYDLRPAILDESGLVPTLRWYIEEYSKRTRTAVHLQTIGLQKRLSPKIEILLYRIIQEALTNVVKHADAESVIITLEKKDLHVHLYITDDGKGFEVKRYFSSSPMVRRGLGILGMKERVELAGGTFFIDSDVSQGTRISIKVPIVKRGA